MKLLNVNTTGNRKLRNTDKIRWIIWNLPAEKTCPFATEMCKASCYAKKAERMYPQVAPCRERNYTETFSPDFVENMIFTIEKELSRKCYHGKTAVVRIHESGDFYDLEYAKKWVTIAKHFEHDNRVVFMAYTKSIIYFNIPAYGTVCPENMVIRSSLWADTKPELIDLTAEMGLPIYTALTAADMETERKNGHRFFKCECSDCSNCGMCWNKRMKDIICEIH